MTTTFLDGYLPYVLRKADQSLSAPFYATLNDRGVARSEWRVLAVLQEIDEVSVADLATAALSPQPTVTHALRRLEERGLVNRIPGAEDKRQRFISLTSKGTELTESLIAEALRLEEEVLADAPNLTELLDQLRTLTANIDAQVKAISSDTVRAS